MVRWPVFLRQKIIDDIKSTTHDKRKSLVQIDKFAGHGVGENQVERTGMLLPQKFASVESQNLQTLVAAKCVSRDLLVFRANIYRGQFGRCIHSVQQPR